MRTKNLFTLLLAILLVACAPAATPAPTQTVLPTEANPFSFPPTPLTSPDFGSLLPQASQLCAESIASATAPAAGVTPGPALILYNVADEGAWHVYYTPDFVPGIPFAGAANKVATLICFKSTPKTLDSYTPAAHEATWQIGVADLHNKQIIASTMLVGKTSFADDNFPPIQLKPQISRFLDHVWGKNALPVFYFEAGNVAKVAFSADNRAVIAAAAKPALGNGGSPIRKWEVHTWQPLVSYALDITTQGSVDDPCSVDFSRDGTRLAIADYPDHVNLLDFETGAILSRFEQGPFTTDSASVQCSALSPDARFVASASTGGEDRIKIWNTSTAQLVSDIALDPKQISLFVPNFVFSPNGNLLAIAGGSYELDKVEDQSLVIWDVASNQKLTTFTLPSNGPVSVAFSPDGKLLAAYSDNQGVVIWDIQTKAERLRLRPTQAGKGERQGKGVAFSSDGKRIACGIVAGVQIFDAASGALLHSYTGPLPDTSVISIAFSPDNTLIAGGTTVQHIPLAYYGGEGTVWVWKVRY